MTTLRISLFAALALSLWACTPPAANPPAEAMATTPDSVYLARGKQVVAATFDTLKRALIEAVATQGPDGAVAYCQVQAYPLTEAIGNREGVSVRRAALRYRNPANAADSLEREIMAEYAGLLIPGQAPPPPRLVRSAAGEVHFFAPIVLLPFCGQCHGQPSLDISAATLAAIQKRYPDDLATGFTPGDLRGLWHVTFRSGSK